MNNTLQPPVIRQSNAIGDWLSNHPIGMKWLAAWQKHLKTCLSGIIRDGGLRGAQQHVTIISFHILSHP